MRKASFRELKSRARSCLDGKHSFFALVTFLVSLANLLLFYLLTSAFPSAGGGLNFILNLACSVLVNIVYFLLLAGLHLIYLKLCRGNTFRLGDLTFAFSSHPEPVAVIALIEFIIQLIPTNLITWSLLRLFYAEKLTDLLTCLPVLLLALVFMFWVEMIFSMILFVYSDAPWESTLQLLKQSYTLLRGNQIRLLLLGLSFIGMGLLTIISFGIGMLFVQPYLYTTQCLFYLDLREPEPACGEKAF